MMPVSCAKKVGTGASLPLCSSPFLLTYSVKHLGVESTNCSVQDCRQASHVPALFYYEATLL